jgi:site-specific recombinase XerD
MHGEEIRELFRRMGIEPETIVIGQVKYAGLRFMWEDRVIALIKQCGGRWSKENRCWYVERKKKVLQKLVCRIAELKGIETMRPEIQQVLKKIRLKGYSEETLRNYVNYLERWLDHFYPRKPAEISKEEVEDYLYRLLWVDKLSESTINGIISAIKFYYEEVCGMSRIIYDLTRPSKPLQIPKLFSKQEVESILKHTENLKHRTILLVCYSSGLRVSEVVNLRVRDIDSGRMVINIMEAKGKKDRVVPLSPVLLGYLRQYFRVYHPKDYLFEGQGKLQYSTRSVQEILKKSKQKAGIRKQGSVHALRHSYATHLLDKGVDITYIQKLLGHHDLKTTLRYLHVTVRDLHRVQSPLDDLDL